MYKTIVNPETGRKVKVSGKIGKKVLNNYKKQYGGQTTGQPTGQSTLAQQAMQERKDASRKQGDRSKALAADRRSMVAALDGIPEDEAEDFLKQVYGVKLGQVADNEGVDTEDLAETLWELANGEEKHDSAQEPPEPQPQAQAQAQREPCVHKQWRELDSGDVCDFKSYMFKVINEVLLHPYSQSIVAMSSREAKIKISVDRLYNNITQQAYVDVYEINNMGDMKYYFDRFETDSETKQMLVDLHAMRKFFHRDINIAEELNFDTTISRDVREFHRKKQELADLERERVRLKAERPDVLKGMLQGRLNDIQVEQANREAMENNTKVQQNLDIMRGRATRQEKYLKQQHATRVTKEKNNCRDESIPLEAKYCCNENDRIVEISNADEKAFGPNVLLPIRKKNSKQCRSQDDLKKIIEEQKARSSLASRAASSFRKFAGTDGYFMGEQREKKLTQRALEKIPFLTIPSHVEMGRKEHKVHLQQQQRLRDEQSKMKEIQQQSHAYKMARRSSGGGKKKSPKRKSKRNNSNKNRNNKKK